MKGKASNFSDKKKSILCKFDKKIIPIFISLNKDDDISVLAVSTFNMEKDCLSFPALLIRKVNLFVCFGGVSHDIKELRLLA